MANISPAVSGSVWGLITGTLANQTDLTSFLSATYFPLGSFTSSFNSSFAGKSTTDLSEGTNLYYTNARVDARIALSNPLDLVSYSYAGGF